MYKSDILKPFIEYYTESELVESVSEFTEGVIFHTEKGWGHMEKNKTGDWDIFIGELKMAEVEGVVYDAIMEGERENEELPNIQTYYEQLRDLFNGSLSDKSKILVRDIMNSLAYLLINEEVVIKKPITIGNYIIFPLDNKKQVICIN